MTALASGVHAPDIELPSLEGSRFSLRDALQRGPVVVAFFKVSCPVCQLAFPFLERIFKAYGQSGAFTFVGVSQDSAADTRAFNRTYGVTFPVLLDEKGKYPASNAYGLTNVPSVFLISTESEIEFASVGWSRQDTEQLNQRLAKIGGQAAIRLFAPGERVPDYKPG